MEEDAQVEAEEEEEEEAEAEHQGTESLAGPATGTDLAEGSPHFYLAATGRAPSERQAITERRASVERREPGPLCAVLSERASSADPPAQFFFLSDPPTKLTGSPTDSMSH